MKIIVISLILCMALLISCSSTQEYDCKDYIYSYEEALNLSYAMIPDVTLSRLDCHYQFTNSTTSIYISFQDCMRTKSNCVLSGCEWKVTPDISGYGRCDTSGGDHYWGIGHDAICICRL